MSSRRTFLGTAVLPRDIYLLATLIFVPLLAGGLVFLAVHSRVISKPEILASTIQSVVSTTVAASGFILVAVAAILGLRRRPHEQVRVLFRLGVGFSVSSLSYAIGAANFALWLTATGSILTSFEPALLVGITAASGAAGFFGLLFLLLGAGDILK